MIFTFTACGTSDAAQNAPVETTTQSENKILVAYFSCSGNTKHLAHTVATALNADEFEILPKIPYSSADLDWRNERSRSTLEMKDDSSRPAISNVIANFAQYETIIIAYPIWWGQAPRIIDTFIESYDFSNKTIIPICTSGGSDINSSVNYLRSISSNSANWKIGKRFNNNTSKDEFLNWYHSI